MRPKILAGVLAAVVTLAACGDDQNVEPAAAATTTAPDANASATATEAPSTQPEATPAPTPAATEAAENESASDVPASDGPMAIVSMSPTATEMLYAIGAGDQVLAVDDFSNYPAEAAEKMAGINGIEPNVEAIVGLGPDLIVTDGTNPDFLAQLDTLGIPHWEGPAAVTFSDIYTQIEQLGAATGHVAEAAALVAQMQADIAAIFDSLPELAAPLTYYHELDPTHYSVTSDTFIGLAYAEAGLVNIADAVGDGNPYPQLSAEFIVSADPDLIFLACTKYCGESPDSVAARAGWGELSAVANGGVIAMDDDIASRWGPRIVEYVKAVGAAITEQAALAAS